jgi:hypothetical protein
MAKRGTFGGTRFGGPGYGKAGFKRGFGRASFGRKADIGLGGGIAKDMMDFFKDMQSGKFGMTKTPQAGLPTERQPRRRPSPVEGPLYEAPAFVQNPYYDSPDTPVPGSKMGPPKPTGTPKGKPAKFRPKLTRGAR